MRALFIFNIHVRVDVCMYMCVFVKAWSISYMNMLILMELRPWEIDIMECFPAHWCEKLCEQIVRVMTIERTIYK